MNAYIEPSVAHGKVTVPPSKSMTHRLLVAAALTRDRQTTISGLSYSEDICATIDCLRDMGAQISEYGDTVIVKGFDPCAATEETVMVCRESGSTLRFLMPIAMLGDAPFRFLGEGRLLDRPVEVYAKICDKFDVFFHQTLKSVNVRGPLSSGKFVIPGEISSQFITGLLYALPLLDGDSDIRLTTRLESRPYIDMTLSVLRNSGIIIEEVSPKQFHVPGNQQYKAVNSRVEGDYSNAAFLEAFRLLGDDVEVDGLSDDSLQGDRIYRTYFRKIKAGCPVLNVRDCPDLAPILMTMAALHNGCELRGTRRLKLKESDRGTAMQKELRKCGARITVKDDSIIVEKAELHRPTSKLNGHNDHRVVMSLAVLASRIGGVITDARAVAKSYPDFWNVLHDLGISLTLK